VGIVGSRLKLAMHILSIHRLGKMVSLTLEHAALRERSIPQVLISEFSGNDVMANNYHR
jgi:hypothetical protein